MRTLEEIIKELETVGKKKVIQRNDLDDQIVINMPLLITTLDYLKEYRAEKGSLAKEAYEKHTRWIENCKKAYDKYKSLELGLIHAHADLLDNPPLSWDDLRKMEGKPVWIWISPRVKNTPGSGHWAIVYRFNPIGGNKNLFEMQMENGSRYKRKYQGDLWQAYRRELA